MDSSLKEVFRLRKIHNAPFRVASAALKGLPGRVNCVASFTLAHSKSFVAVGCADGLWILDQDDPDLMHKVLDIKAVSDIAILEEFYIALVLSDRALYCYSLDSLDPFNDSPSSPAKLSEAHSLDYFRVGTCNDKLLVIYKKRQATRVTDSVFHVLQPLFTPPVSSPTSLPTICVSFGHQRSYYFQTLKDFFVPTDCTDIVFLKNSLAILHTRGFELMDLTCLESVTIPQLTGDLLKRSRNSKPIALLRGPTPDSPTLLCYTTFGLFVTKHGHPLAEDEYPPVEWRTPAHSALAVPPYVVLFKPQSLEVRHAGSGRLEQVVFGGGMRYAGGRYVVVQSEEVRGKGESVQFLYELVRKDIGTP